MQPFIFGHYVAHSSFGYYATHQFFWYYATLCFRALCSPFFLRVLCNPSFFLGTMQPFSPSEYYATHHTFQALCSPFSSSRVLYNRVGTMQPVFHLRTTHPLSSIGYYVTLIYPFFGCYTTHRLFKHCATLSLASGTMQPTFFILVHFTA